MDHRAWSIWSARGGLAVLAAMALAAGGCQTAKPLKSPYTGFDGIALHKTFAVLPILNQTGSNEIAREDYDVQEVFVGQLRQVRGLSVLPMARVRAYLAAKGAVTASTPQQVIELARELNVDGVIVAAITSFDPYEPPVVGMTVALFRRPDEGLAELPDPILLSREPALVRHEPRQSELVNQQVFQFDARNEEVVDRVKAFAAQRGGTEESPWGWRRYVVSAREYLTFCSYEALRTLLASEAKMIAAGRARAEESRRAEHESHESDEFHE